MLGEEESKVMSPEEIKAKFANCGDTLKLWGNYPFISTFHIFIHFFFSHLPF